MKKKLLALFLALVMVGAVLPGCGDGSKDPGGQGNNGKTGEPVKGGEITVGIAQDLDDSLDPHQTVAAGTREVLFNIFEGLVKPNSDGEMIPAVAEKYTLSEDGTTYTFTLREGVKFHNGQTVTAEDVVYSINRCAAVPEGQEKPLVAAFSAVKSVEALDEKTVAVTIAQRDLEFISYMTAAIIPADYENQDTAPVGTGPFRFVSRTPQQDFVMERFEDYWGAPAWLDKVTYKICENADALVMNLNGGSFRFFTAASTGWSPCKAASTASWNRRASRSKKPSSSISSRPGPSSSRGPQSSKAGVQRTLRRLSHRPIRFSGPYCRRASGQAAG